MYRNLEVEQVRLGYSDDFVAEKLGITPKTYHLRKMSGEFTPPEIVMLVEMYDKSMDYLFRKEGGHSPLSQRTGIFR